MPMLDTCPIPTRSAAGYSLLEILVVLLLLAVIPEFFIDHYAHFKQQGITVDASFGFYAWYSFLAGAAFIAGAKLVGIFLKRRDSYYDE